MLFAWANGAEVFLWAKSVHHSAKGSHGEEESHDDSHYNDESKCSEHNDLCKEQPDSTTNSGDTTTQDTNAHFSVGLSHLVLSSNCR